MAEAVVVQEHLRFSAEGLRLEGLLAYRDDVASGERVLLLSPHPHFAGDMNNNVVRGLAEDLAAAGRICLRFDYHAVEGSQAPQLSGESIWDYWRRVEEARDYARAISDAAGAFAALGEVAGGVPGGVVVGYSFGALVAALVAPRLEGLRSLVLVSPPFGKIDLSALVSPGCPVLVLAGRKDFVYDAVALERAREGLGSELEVLPEADHFFRGEEAALAARVEGFLSRSAPLPCEAEPRSAGPRSPDR